MKDQEIRLQILVPHAAFLRQPNRAELQIESQKNFIFAAYLINRQHRV